MSVESAEWTRISRVVMGDCVVGARECGHLGDERYDEYEYGAEHSGHELLLYIFFNKK